MKNIPMLVNFVLDESPSMIQRQAEAISGFNEYIATLKEKGTEVLFSLTKFSGSRMINVVRVAEFIEDVPDLCKDTYTPQRGNGTALYDAVGVTIQEVEKRVEKNSDQAVLVVILTDGEENCSRKFTAEQVKAMITQKEGEGNWTFVFLGADKEAWNVGASMGISVGNVAQYQADNFIGVMRAAGGSTDKYSRRLKKGSLQTQSFCSSNQEDYMKDADMDDVLAKDKEES